MWWQFYTGLSVRVIDSLIDALGSPASSAPAVSSSTPSPSSDTPTPVLNQMLAGIARDIETFTEEQRMELKAELAAQARALCLNEISHDLRTPLNAIIGFTQLMESGIFGPVGNPQYNEYLRHIRESGYELLGRIEELLDGPSPSSPQPTGTPALQEAAA